MVSGLFSVVQKGGDRAWAVHWLIKPTEPCCHLEMGPGLIPALPLPHLQLNRAQLQPPPPHHLRLPSATALAGCSLSLTHFFSVLDLLSFSVKWLIQVQKLQSHRLEQQRQWECLSSFLNLGPKGLPNTFHKIILWKHRGTSLRLRHVLHILRPSYILNLLKKKKKKEYLVSCLRSHMSQSTGTTQTVSSEVGSW